jgi:hypothetical protein
MDDSTLEKDKDYLRRSGDRPMMITEIRAWLLAACVLLGQTVTAVWWAASITQKVENVIVQNNVIDSRLSRQYTAAEAEKDFARINRDMSELTARTRVLEQELLSIKAARR